MSRACRVETRVHLVAEVANRKASVPGGLSTQLALIGSIGNKNRLHCSPGSQRHRMLFRMLHLAKVGELVLDKENLVSSVCPLVEPRSNLSEQSGDTRPDLNN